MSVITNRPTKPTREAKLLHVTLRYVSQSFVLKNKRPAKNGLFRIYLFLSYSIKCKWNVFLQSCILVVTKNSWVISQKIPSASLIRPFLLDCIHISEGMNAWFWVREGLLFSWGWRGKPVTFLTPLSVILTHLPLQWKPATKSFSWIASCI